MRTYNLKSNYWAVITTTNLAETLIDKEHGKIHYISTDKGKAFSHWIDAPNGARIVYLSLDSVLRLVEIEAAHRARVPEMMTFYRDTDLFFLETFGWLMFDDESRAERVREARAA